MSAVVFGGGVGGGFGPGCPLPVVALRVNLSTSRRVSTRPKPNRATALGALVERGSRRAPSGRGILLGLGERARLDPP